jgi:hypothetical protein
MLSATLPRIDWQAIANRCKFRIRLPNIRKNPALKWNGGNDYAFKEGQETIWIECNGHSFYLRRTSKGFETEIISHGEGGELQTVARCEHTIW